MKYEKNKRKVQFVPIAGLSLLTPVCISRITFADANVAKLVNVFDVADVLWLIGL